MKIQKLLISKFRNHLRVSTGLYRIRIIREQRVQNHAVKHTFRRRECSLHLIVYNTTDRQFSIRIIQFITPTFLTECLVMLIDIRIKYRIHIDMHQVLEILIIAACHRIYRLVRISHRIQKCIQRTLHKLNKRILHREFFRSTQNGMFHNVWNSCAVCRWCTESNRKHLVLVIIFHKEYSRSAFLVLQKCPL